MQGRGQHAGAGAEPGVDEPVGSEPVDDDAIQPGPGERHPQGEDVSAAHPDEVWTTERGPGVRRVELAQVQVEGMQAEGGEGLDLQLGVGPAPVSSWPSSAFATTQPLRSPRTSRASTSGCAPSW